MILGDLLHLEVRDADDRKVGTVIDVRFVIDGIPRELLADARLDGLLVSPHSGTSFLGYERNIATAPFLLASLLRWRHRGTFLVRWADVAMITSTTLHLRDGYRSLDPTLPKYR